MPTQVPEDNVALARRREEISGDALLKSAAALRLHAEDSAQCQYLLHSKSARLLSQAADEIDRLRAELAECKRDAELWRAHHARKQAVIDAGMARNPMRAVAANMCPHCYAIVGAPHEAWCRSTQINAALAAKEE